MSTILAGRTALVTGAGRGIGRELAIGLASTGARVALMSRTESELREVAALIAASGGVAETFVADVGDAEQLSDAVGRIGSSLGTVEILINNAAVAFPLGPTETLAATEIRAALEVNVTAVIVLSGLVIPAMRHAGWGRIVNVSSGVVANPAGMIGATVYAATKGALEAHTLNLAAELANTGICVNVYRPGAVDTAMQTWIRDQPPDAVGHALHEHFVTVYESGQLLTPEQSAARLLDRLAGEGTGQIWSVRDR